MYSIAIVDDEAAIRNGLARRIDWASLGYRVAGTFEDGEDALEFLERNTVDVILTDIRMAVVSGLDVAREAATRYPQTTIVLLSGYREFDYAREAMRYGVRHYLLKPTVPDEVREVFAGIREEIDSRPERPDPSPAVSEIESPAQATIRNAQRFVRDHLAEELTLDRMAREFYFSPAYFSRLFSRVAGCSFLEYVKQQRMARAATLLRARPARRIQHVARDVGLSDRRYFSRLFKERYGVTPTAYRVSLRARSDVAEERRDRDE
jgi:YesN/AraC family two-component response regulator